MALVHPTRLPATRMSKLTATQFVKIANHPYVKTTSHPVVKTTHHPVNTPKLKAISSIYGTFIELKHAAVVIPYEAYLVYPTHTKPKKKQNKVTTNQILRGKGQ